MTAGASARQERENLFVADFYPQLGEYLAEQHAIGYDASAGRARFQAWLSENADDDGGGDEEIFVRGDGDDLPAEPTASADPIVDPLKDYLKHVSNVPWLSAEQEIELASRIRAGRVAEEKLAASSGTLSADARIDLEKLAEEGAQAQNYLLEANLRLVVSLAKRYTGRGMLFLDLVQEGNLGLIRAMEKFDGTRGYKFSTYATWWIRQAITKAVADQARTTRIPVHMVELINEFARVRRRLRRDLGREPTAAELAVELGMPEEKVDEAKKYVRPPTPPALGDDPGPATG